jgi:hypothetical protein
MGRWKFSCEARDPKQPTTSTWEVGILERKYLLIRDKGHEVRLARMLLAAEVVQDPISIYAGWSRPGRESCIVYVGKPTRDYQSITIQRPAPPGMLFLVFVMEDGSIDDWTWREATAGDPDVPNGVAGTLIWPL